MVMLKYIKKKGSSDVSDRLILILNETDSKDKFRWIEISCYSRSLQSDERLVKGRLSHTQYFITQMMSPVAKV